MADFHPSKVLVTGVLGQDGAYLSELALRLGCEVVGGARLAGGTEVHARAWRLRHLGIAERVRLLHFDLRDAAAMAATLAAEAPDVVFNLAAQSSVAQSFATPVEMAETNGMGALHLFEAVRLAGRPMRVVQAASADIVAGGAGGAVNAASPYGAAKAFAHLMARVYRESLGTFVASALLYNHESPLRGEGFVTRKIIQGLVRQAAGQSGPLHLGNLDARRDWSHARDIVEGLWCIACAAAPGEYALGSGHTHSIREFVDRAAAQLGMALAWQGSGTGETATNRATGRTVVAVDPAFYRPADTSHAPADTAPARALGWAPKVSLDALIGEMIEFERNATSGSIQ